MNEIKGFVLCSLFAMVQSKSGNFMKFTKVSCRTSGITCKNPYCNVKPFSQALSFMNFGCEVENPFDNVHARFTGWIRSLSGNTWRQIISFPDPDVCETLNRFDSLGYLRETASWIRRTFPEMWPNKCPFTQMLVTNASYQPYLIDGKPAQNFNPNGVYKFNMSMFNEADPLICELTYTSEVQYHFNIKELK